MIRAHELIGRAVVDMDAAEKLGNVKEILVSQNGERVAGFVVARGESIFGSGVHRNIPASAVHIIGPDAITVSGAGAMEGASELASLPRVSDVIGRKMVSRSGRLLGSIADVLINPADGTILGFSIGEGAKSKLENLFGAEKARSTSYVRADADLQVGKDLIVVPDEALVQSEPKETAAPPSAEGTDMGPIAQEPSGAESAGRWGGTASTSTRKSVWSGRAPVAQGAPVSQPKEARTGEQTSASEYEG